MRFSQILAKFAVSLFMGERIEMTEAVEKAHWFMSPSLWGSGLKYTKTATAL